MKLKRILAYLLLFSLLLAPCARAAEGDVNFRGGDEPFASLGGFPRGGCAAGGALYLYTDQYIYTWRPGDASPTALEYALPAADGESHTVERLFADGERLCALCGTYSESYELTGLEIAEVTVEVTVEGEAVSFGTPTEVPADDLAVYYGDEAQLAQIGGSVAAGGALCLDVWSDTGERKLYIQPLDGGEGEFIDVENLAGIAAYDGDRLLIETFDRSAKRCELWLLDPASNELTPACAPVESDAALGGLAYSAESGRLYYLADGYVMAAEGFDLASAQPIAQLMARYLDEAASFVLPGELYALVNPADGICVRSTAPGALPEDRLVVQGGGLFSAMVDAYYDFNATHSDAAAVLREDYANDDAVLNDILSRDDSVDVRVTMASSELYDALRNRGYLAPLDDATIADAVGKMYPAVQDALTLDGSIVAVPVYAAGWALGLDFEGFERIGIPRDEVPDSWPAFLDLLPTLPERIGEDDRVRVFPEYDTQVQVRTELIGAILDDWLMHLRANDLPLSYDSPELCALLEKAMALDLDALGVKKGNEDEEYAMVAVSGGLDMDDRDYTLVNPNADCMLTGSEIVEPALLAVTPGEAAPVPIDLAVVFVNPFSKHIDLAQEYLARICENLDEDSLYALSDEYSEPVPWPAYEREIAEVEREMEEAKAKLETAAPEDAQQWEDAVAAAEYRREMLEAQRWRISPESIEWYRAHGERLMVKGYSYVSATDSSGEFQDLVQQFLAGRMDAESFLREIDRKVQMKLREGA